MYDSKVIPIVFDLDKTLTKENTLFAQIRGLRFEDLNILFKFFVAMFQKKNALAKSLLSDIIPTRRSKVNLNLSIVNFLRKNNAEGRRVMIVTAANQTFAKKFVKSNIGDYEVVGSTLTENLKGIVKADFLVSIFGKNGFDYVGDSKSDIPVWHAARGGYIVNPNMCLRFRLKKEDLTEKIRVI